MDHPKVAEEIINKIHDYLDEYITDKEYEELSDIIIDVLDSQKTTK